MHNDINMQQGYDIGLAMYYYISKKSAIDIAFRKALLHKNEVTKKIVYHVLALT